MSDQNPKREIIEHLPALRAFALNLTRNPSLADDMVQDAVEKAWKNFDKYKAGTNLRAWLFTILRNTYYTNRRRAQREVGDPEGEIVGRLSVKPDHDGHIQLDEFREALAKLNIEQREALLLVGASGFSYEEAAEMCGCAVGTIKSRISRARENLAILMQIEGNEPLEMTDAQTMAVISQNAV